MSIFTLTDDIVLKILFNLEDDDPRHLARLVCVCTRFSLLIRDVCWKSKCLKTIPSVVSDLGSSSPPTDSSPPGGWSALHKLSVCCPGLHHAGVLLENSDFGLERELGPDQNYPVDVTSFSISTSEDSKEAIPAPTTMEAISSDNSWSLYDDLYFDTIYDVSETLERPDLPAELERLSELGGGEVIKMDMDISPQSKKRKKCEPSQAHLADGVWNLSREQGNKLLASRFRGDCLYICDWPGCVHTEEKRNYMLFRGIFKNFKKSQVWRTINDGNRSKINLDCAFCPCRETWDLHSAFCLRRVFGYHDNGEPVVRAYVCENGHVSGAWTERPMYS